MIEVTKALSDENRVKLLIELKKSDDGRIILPSEELFKWGSCLRVFYHNHLPKLAQLGYITYNDRSGGLENIVVERSEKFDELNPILDCIEENYL